MSEPNTNLECLLALPPGMVDAFHRLENKPARDFFCASPNPALGSGGVIAHTLLACWQARRRNGQTFMEWLSFGHKIVIAGADGCLALPAYAATGVALIPVPVLRWSRGQRLDQCLLDLQLESLRRLAGHAGPGRVILVTAPDTLLQLPAKLPDFPAVDVLGLGLWESTDTARSGGIFACSRHNPAVLSFYQYQPTKTQLREWFMEHLCLADTGVWLLSPKAVELLCRKAMPSRPSARTKPNAYDFARQFGAALGRKPQRMDRDLARLSTSCVPLNEAHRFRFHTSRQLIEAASRLQNVEVDEAKLGIMGVKRHPHAYLQNSRSEYRLQLDRNHTIWIENSVIGPRWQLACEHVITGVPDNNWSLALERGNCLDFAPIGKSEFCVRAYGIDDDFSGKLGDPQAHWFGRPAPEWFSLRGLKPQDLGLTTGTALHDAALFPVLDARALDPHFLQWLFAATPEPSLEFTRQYCQARRLSNRQVVAQINALRLYSQRARLRQDCLLPMLRNFRYSVFFKLDLESTARLFADANLKLPTLDLQASAGLEPLQEVHDQMFRAAVLRHRRRRGWERFEDNAFERLRNTIIRDAQLSPALPRLSVQEDQIVWGRSPVRLDLAGGWTDTPPYCLEYGGKVVNVAADLNGQPPIQVFAKLCPRPELVLRSIDLGVEQRIRTYEELDTYAVPGSEFALAKAACALAGFLPRFHAEGGARTLKQQLESFGGGIELSLLSAVPKGSGLGTSSILAATILATISDLCGLNWDKNVLFKRTLALEQMLTTGGGWQDQAGAIFRGVKLVETDPGLKQTPTLRWLPGHLFERDYANKTILLYYTGITRLAKNILQEIVRGIFLNSPNHLRIVDAIGRNADRTFAALQECHYPNLITAIETSWRLNQELDSGTNPPAIQRILNRVGGHLAATKLLGAGGGGFLLMLAKDEAAAGEIRRRLTEHPPNPRARFVELSLSETGLQVTRS